VTLQTLAYALYRCLGHWTIHYFLLWNTCLYFLLIIEDGIYNVTLRLSNALYFFRLASSIIIIMTFVHVHTATSLLPKNCSQKKAKK
jgi:hypothetical protein